MAAAVAAVLEVCFQTLQLLPQGLTRLSSALVVLAQPRQIPRVQTGTLHLLLDLPQQAVVVAVEIG
jgi:hypothetical protein